MLRLLNRFLSAGWRASLAAGSVLLVAAIGAIDYLTGYELSLSIFYLIPVGMSSWYAGYRLGIPVCVISAATWLGVDRALGHQYSHAAIPFWNAVVRLGFFVIVTYLLVRLRGALEIQESLAQQDGLTGIMNARAFTLRWNAVAHLAGRHGRPMALGYLDLDGFKGVNDSFGHSGGDRTLKAVASEIARRLRASDSVGRMGGDEFAILLPETGVSGARSFFTEMRENLAGLAARNGWPVGFSIGVAVFQPPPPNSEDAIRRADDLMYRVKKAGGNAILLEECAGEAREGLQRAPRESPSP